MSQEQHSQPIFTPDWGADEELLLISGLIINGLGNWAEVAGHVGTRTKEECENHYLEVYLGVGKGQVREDGLAEAGVCDKSGNKRRREFMPVPQAVTLPTSTHQSCSPCIKKSSLTKMNSMLRRRHG